MFPHPSQPRHRPPYHRPSRQGVSTGRMSRRVSKAKAKEERAQPINGPKVMYFRKYLYALSGRESANASRRCTGRQERKSNFQTSRGTRTPRQGGRCVGWEVKEGGRVGGMVPVGFLRARSIMGRCTGRLTLSGIDVRIPRKGIFNLLKPGKTNGAALVHVVGHVATPSDNLIHFGKHRFRPRSVCRVNCLPRRHNLCGGVGINRRTVCLTRLGKLSCRRTHVQLVH